MGSKIGRNDPCPCGSGLKFKKCHSRRDVDEESWKGDLFEWLEPSSGPAGEANFVFNGDPALCGWRMDGVHLIPTIPFESFMRERAIGEEEISLKINAVRNRLDDLGWLHTREINAVLDYSQPNAANLLREDQNWISELDRASDRSAVKLPHAFVTTTLPIDIAGEKVDQILMVMPKTMAEAEKEHPSPDRNRFATHVVTHELVHLFGASKSFWPGAIRFSIADLELFADCVSFEINGADMTPETFSYLYPHVAGGRGHASNDTLRIAAKRVLRNFRGGPITPGLEC